MKSLDRKLLRDLGKHRGQVITIALVVACGIASFVTLRTTYVSLRGSQAAYYDSYRFADVFASLERAPESVEGQLELIDGVARVGTRVVDTIRLPMRDMDQPATGRLVSLPPGGEAPLNGVYLREGRMVEAGRGDEAVVLEAFANAHELELGARLPAVINGTLRDLTVVGIGMSPEYVFAMKPGDFAPDDRGFTVVWMDRDAIAPAFDMDGAFNDVSLSLQPGANEAAVRREVDRILEPYGGLGSVGRDRQMSHFALSQELTQLESMATSAPAIFLFVAAFLLNIVLTRLIALQRPQVAALKALGYADRAIGLHYLELVSVIVLLGAIVGVGLGGWLGRGFTELYTQFFRMPVLRYHLDPMIAFQACAVSLVAGVVGALRAVRAVVKLPPAEAMRPPAPLDYRSGLLERLGVLRFVGQSARMIFREVRRRPMRLLLSALGIALAVAILVVGRFFVDAMGYLMDVYMAAAQREDVVVTYAGPMPERTRGELAHIPGVEYVEGLRVVAVRYRVGHRQRDSAIYGYADPPELRRLIDGDAMPVELPDDGVLLTRKLAEILHVEVGEHVEVEILEGDRRTVDLEVAGLVEELFGIQGHMRQASLNRLMREEAAISMALLQIDGSRWDQVRRRLADMPRVAGFARKDAGIDQFRQQQGETNRVFTLILAIFASIIAIGVVYNNARVSLSMRSRDLASLRVLGFTRAEISAILLGELALQVALAIPVGLWLGAQMAGAMISQTDPEVYRLPLIISSRTYTFATLVTLASALISALLVRRKLDNLDLIAVLKTRQ